jgi:hypothetical protein
MWHFYTHGFKEVLGENEIIKKKNVLQNSCKCFSKMVLVEKHQKKIVT